MTGIYAQLWKTEIWDLLEARCSWLNKHDNSSVVMWETALDVISKMTKLEKKYWNAQHQQMKA